MDVSPLAKLPGELRNNNYELVFESDSEIELDVNGSKISRTYRRNARANDPKVRSYNLALTTTCKEIRRESLSVFWFKTNNRFYQRIGKLYRVDHNSEISDEAQRSFITTSSAAVEDWFRLQIAAAGKLPRVIFYLGPNTHYSSTDMLVDTLGRYKDVFHRVGVEAKLKVDWDISDGITNLPRVTLDFTKRLRYGIIAEFQSKCEELLSGETTPRAHFLIDMLLRCFVKRLARDQRWPWVD